MADTEVATFNNVRNSKITSAPIKAGVKLIPGTFSLIDSSGRAVRAGDTASCKNGGLVLGGDGPAGSSDNTDGSDGDINVRLLQGGVVFIPAGSGFTPADSDYGAQVFYSANNEVKKTATNYALAGHVIQKDTVNGVAGVWIQQNTPGEASDLSAVTTLTDNSGGAAADGTIGAVTAPTALTDNGGGTADGIVASQAAPVTLTDNSGLSGSHDDTVAAMSAPAALTENAGAIGGTSDGDLPALVDPNGDAGATVIAGIREVATRCNTLGTLAGVTAQNVSDVTQKVIELVTLATTAQNNLKELTTAQAANRTAIIALTDAVKELSTKINAIINA